jgi:branched-chain amino acid transport system permease protein
VVILGGLTSVPGAIIGGLIIGVGEKLSEVYIGPMVGGGIETWFAYVWPFASCWFGPKACSATRSLTASERGEQEYVLS